MARKLFHLIILTALFTAALSMSIFAVDSRVASKQSNTLNHYGLSSAKKIDGGQSYNFDKSSSSSPSSLGAYASDGGSPGYIIGRSWRDDQAHINPGNFIDLGSDGTVHFIYNFQQCAGYTNATTCARYIQYNMFDPSVTPNGVFINGTQGIPLQPNPLQVEAGQFPQMVLSETDRMIVAAEVFNPNELEAFAPFTKLWWDISPIGTDQGSGFINDTLPMTRQTNDTTLRYQQPRIDRQEYDGNYVLHVLSLFGEGTLEGGREMYYHRRVTTAVTSATGTWTSLLIGDDVWSNHQDMGTSRSADGRVSLAYVGYYQQDAEPPLWFMTSTDAGETWSTKVDISTYIEGEQDFAPWVECSVQIDGDGYSHVVWNASENNNIDPEKIFHWTDRVVGDVHGGKISTVEWIEDILNDVDCTVSSNAGVLGKPTITECNDKMYVIWQRFGDPDFPDDCAADSVSDGFRGAANSDIFMNVSLTVDGSLWDARRNLTNSHTPECDGSDAFPCDHDAFPSPSRNGRSTATMGTTYWGAVPEAFEVRDALDNSYSVDSFYIDVQFVNDIIADVARYMDDPVEFWSNNPIKWFRLPCVDPVVEPRVVITTDDFLHPTNWVPSGTEVALDIEFENIGNDVLNITNVSSDGGSWLQINTTSLTTAPSTGDLISLTLNPGNAINPTGTDAVAMNAYIVIESNAPSSPDSFLIQSVITENVVAVTTAVIRTGRGVPLIIANNGTAGNTSQGIPGTGGNLSFYEEGGIDDDLDSAGVYLYDASPILMYDNANYYWAPYWDPTDVDHATNFFPVPGGVLAEAGAGSGFDQFTTGQFVTGDSTIGMIKTWGAPDGLDVTYMIEKWQIYSYDGLAHPGLHVGEWVDMDVPADTGANNYGFVSEDDDYLWVSGQEANFDGLVNNDTRFYTTGLLGYYWQSEFEIDDQVNTTGLAAAYVTITEDLMPANQNFDPDSMWNYMTGGLFEANNSDWDDQRSLISIGQFDITENDTLVVWIVHGSMIGAATDGSDVAALISDAKVWYMANRDEFGVFGCCGLYTGGYPGNTNSDVAGLRDLADITKLIDNVYISKLPLVCPENGNVNGDVAGLVNLADITKLIDHVYISKVEVPNCI